VNSAESKRGYTDDRALKLARAREYPYVIPRSSYIYKDEGVGGFDPDLCAGRTPVLAIGSNQSPSRLAQKFGGDAAHVIPVQRALLKDFDVVYSAHIASYGAVPAMLQVSAGSEVEVAVTWLNDEQVGIMHESETRAANYDLATLEGVTLTLHGGGQAQRVHVYVSSRGHLSEADGGAIALSAIRCRGRRYPSMTTSEALEVVRRQVAPHTDADEFVLRLVNDDAYRLGVSGQLGADAVPFRHPFETPS
jgi:hypothetical protein